MRLAYEQGLLKQKRLSKLQLWALLYWMYLDRRTRMEDTRAELIQQTFNLFPDRWVELYRADVMNQLGIREEPAAPEQNISEDDYATIDQFLARQDQIATKRWIHADRLGLPADWKPDTQGARV